MKYLFSLEWRRCAGQKVACTSQSQSAVLKRSKTRKSLTVGAGRESCIFSWPHTAQIMLLNADESMTSTVDADVTGSGSPNSCRVDAICYIRATDSFNTLTFAAFTLSMLISLL